MGHPISSPFFISGDAFLSPPFPRLPLPQVNAMVLAGGRGSRLLGLTDTQAKPAVPFGPHHRLLDFTLSNCVNSGIVRIGVLTDYQGEALERVISAGWVPFAERHGRRVDLLRAPGDGAPSRGTAEAVLRQRAWIEAGRPRWVLILAGDHVYNMDYGDMLAQHLRTRARVTVGCVEVPVAQASAFGVMRVETSGRIVAFEEKPTHPRPTVIGGSTALASMGIYLFDRAYLMELLEADAECATSHHDFGRDLIPAAVDAGGAYAHRLHDPLHAGQIGYWRDVGTLDAYWRCTLDLLDAGPLGSVFHRKGWPLWNGAAMPVDPLVCPRMPRSGVERTVVGRGATIAPGSRVVDSVLLPGAHVGPGCEIRNAIVGDGCRIPAGTQIGFSEVRDRQRFDVSRDGVVLVTARHANALAQENGRVTTPEHRGQRMPGGAYLPPPLCDVAGATIST